MRAEGVGHQAKEARGPGHSSGRGLAPGRHWRGHLVPYSRRYEICCTLWCCRGDGRVYVVEVGEHSGPPAPPQGDMTDTRKYAMARKSPCKMRSICSKRISRTSKDLFRQYEAAGH
jgi:hypothetical protein